MVALRFQAWLRRGKQATPERMARVTHARFPGDEASWRTGSKDRSSALLNDRAV